MATTLRTVLAATAVLASLLPTMAGAATLAEAVRHWTGRTPDVFGRGADVTIDLPPAGAVPPLTAHAETGLRHGDPGWQLSDLKMSLPARLNHGLVMAAGQQHGSAWLGESTLSADVALDDVTLTSRDGMAMLDHARASLTGTTGPVSIAVTLDGLHVPRAAQADADLVPRHIALRAHTDQGGAAALAAMLDGGAPPRGTVIIDEANAVIGPAQFNASGTITIAGPHDRHGTLTIVGTGFKELLRQMPTTGPATAAYPLLMILRQMGHKEAGGLRWTAIFNGNQILVEGLDISPLLGN